MLHVRRRGIRWFPRSFFIVIRQNAEFLRHAFKFILIPINHKLEQKLMIFVPPPKEIGCQEYMERMTSYVIGSITRPTIIVASMQLYLLVIEIIVIKY